MENENVYGEDIDRLDLGKYGLADLEGRDMLALEPADMDRLLTALGNDDMSLYVPIPCTEENVREVLSYSHCRRCGRCCRPNPLNPGSPGVEVFEEELKSMADHAGVSHEELRKKTAQGSTSPYAFQAVKLGFTRWLPLPCPLYSEEHQGCLAYGARAVVCSTYPIIFTGDDSCMSIRVTCDYGRDIVGAACKRLKADDPALEIRI